MKMKKIWILLLLSLILITGCTQKTPKNLNSYRSINYTAGFDTFLQLVGYTETQEQLDQEMKKAVEIFTLYNNYFDIYNTYENINNLKTINDNAGIAPVEVNDEIIECLLKAKEFYELSNHEFDITLGALLQVWHNYREEGIELNNNGELGKLPNEEELKKAKACTGWQYVEIDEEKKTVYINNPCVSLDVGGIAKGFSAEKIAQALEDELYAGIVNAGGNNRTMSTKPDGSSWNSGIQHPNDLAKSLLVVSVENSQSVVTSGDYQRYYIAEDLKAYHHIIDPSTNYPASLYRSVTIITKDSGDADALSTTLFTLSIEEGKQVLENYNQAHPDTPAGAVWIMEKENATQDSLGFETNDFYVVVTENYANKIQIYQQ